MVTIESAYLNVNDGHIERKLWFHSPVGVLCAYKERHTEEMYVDDSQKVRFELMTADQSRFAEMQ